MTDPFADIFQQTAAGSAAAPAGDGSAPGVTVRRAIVAAFALSVAFLLAATFGLIDNGVDANDHVVTKPP